MTLVVDTNAYSAYRRGGEAVTTLLEEADELILPTVVAGELIAGFLQGSRWETNWADLKTFLSQPGIRSLAPDLSVAEKYGWLVKVLKEAGTPIPTNDIWIAASALSTGAAVLTNDAHFGKIAGLFVVSY